MRMKFGLRHYAGLTVAFAAAAATVLLMAGGAFGSVTGAVSTTDNVGFADANNYTDQACSNGHGVNCNIYLDKRDVWMSGLPNSASLAEGTYFFAVIVPGGQPDPNDGGAKNLSDTTDDPWAAGHLNVDGSAVPTGDLYGNRTFTVDSSGNITYGGTHVVAGNGTPGAKIQMFPYDDTTNDGGVYILAVCSLGADGTAYPVDPHNCKYDAFKVQTGTPPTTPPAFDLTAFKSATPSFTRTYGWDVSKSVDKTKVEQIGGTAAFNYTVTATWSGPTDSGWQVDGTIDVLNPNAATVDASVSDQITTDGTTDDGNETCTVYDPVNTTTALSNPYTLGANSDTAFPYTCVYNSSGPAASSETNVATISWAAQTLSNQAELAAGSTPATAAIDWTTPTTIVNASTTVSDNFNSGGAQALGLANIDGSWTTDAGNHLAGFAESYANGTKTFTLTYSRTITVPAHGCLSYSNTATESSATDATTPDSVTVQVCGPANTSALTIGFWKNNGQQLLQYYACPAGKQTLAAYLAGLGGGSGPFSTASGCDLRNYVTNILQGATATNMNVMLKAQMLATALDVYFSDPTKGYTSQAVGKTKPPSTFLTHGSLGGFNMDMTAVCPMVDNSTTGTASCKNAMPSTNGFASGAVPSAAMTIQAILTYAATSPSPYSAGVWYAGDRTKQEILKNIFDQINNSDAFAA
jgi:hypothetical protein